MNVNVPACVCEGVYECAWVNMCLHVCVKVCMSVRKCISVQVYLSVHVLENACEVYIRLPCLGMHILTVIAELVA